MVKINKKLKTRHSNKKRKAHSSKNKKKKAKARALWFGKIEELECERLFAEMCVSA